MIEKKRFPLSVVVVGILVVVLALTVGIAVAGNTDDGGSGLTLQVPVSYASCEPGPDEIVLSGVPDGFKAQIDVRRFFPDNSSVLLASTGPVDPDDGKVVLWFDNYPPVDQWDVNPDTGERSIVLAAFGVVFNDDWTVKDNVSEKWTVTCTKEEPTKTPEPTPTKTPEPTPTNTPEPPTPTPEPAEGEGCTPGYWRQPHHYDSWVATGYSPDDTFASIFGVGPSIALGDAVQLNGGGENAMIRHAVAALLNAASPDVTYAFSVNDVISMVQDAYANGTFEAVKDQFEAENEAGCPLN